jgi:hypothetical protein
VLLIAAWFSYPAGLNERTLCENRCSAGRLLTLCPAISSLEPRRNLTTMRTENPFPNVPAPATPARHPSGWRALRIVLGASANGV